MILQAPYNLAETVIILPSPNWGNTEENSIDVIFGDAQDSTQWTYVRKTDNTKLIYDLSLARPKAKELDAFLRLYHTTKIKLVDQDDVSWKVSLVNPLVEFSRLGINERSELRLEFLGVPL